MATDTTAAATTVADATATATTTTTTTTKPKPIRPLLGNGALSDADYLTRLNAIIKGMDGSALLPDSPVPIPDLKTAVGTYSDAISAALDGGKAAKAAVKQAREVVNGMVRQIGQYVESANNGNMTVFLSSGFLPAAVGKKTSSALPAVPSISGVVQGNIGQFLVSVSGSDARSTRLNEITCTPIGAGGTPGTAVSVYFTQTKSAIAVNGLTPGTNYSLQVRAFGRKGPTDWSPAVTRIAN